MKANASNAPLELKLNSNYITRFGQVGCGVGTGLRGQRLVDLPLGE